MCNGQSKAVHFVDKKNCRILNYLFIHTIFLLRNVIWVWTLKWSKITLNIHDVQANGFSACDKTL